MLADRPLLLEPYYYGILARDGHWDAGPLVGRICAGDVGLLILNHRLEEDPPPYHGYDRWPTPVFRATGLGIGDTVTVAGPAGTIEVTLVGETFEVAQESPSNTVLRGTWTDVMTLDADARLDRWEIRPRDGIAPRAVAEDLFQASGYSVAAYTLDDSTSDEEFILFLSVVTAMGIVLGAISLGGVFDTVLLETRRRTRELAVLKTVGLTPAGVVAMVVAGVVPLGLLAGVIGLPLGLAAQRAVIGYMGEVAGRTTIPDLAYDVFPPLGLLGLGLVGLAIAAAGAYVPGQRAAAARIAPVLATE